MPVCSLTHYGDSFANDLPAGWKKRVDLDVTLSSLAPMFLKCNITVRMDADADQTIRALTRKRTLLAMHFRHLGCPESCGGLYF